MTHCSSVLDRPRSAWIARSAVTTAVSSKNARPTATLATISTARCCVVSALDTRAAYPAGCQPDGVVGATPIPRR